MGRKTREPVERAIRPSMEEAVLSAKLGHYQQREKLYQMAGLFGIIGGMISFFITEEPWLQTILTGTLFGGGLCCLLFLRDRARKKGKALMEEQLSHDFRQELERRFGSSMETEAMRIDTALMKALPLLQGRWEACATDHFYEGIHDGLHFSAANVRLDHVYTRGNIREGKIPCQDVVFQGIVIRFQTPCPAPAAIAVPTASGEGTPWHSMLQEWMHHMGHIIEGQVQALYWEGDVLSLAIETAYGFASPASHVDRSDLPAVRQSYRRSLQEMGDVLTLLQHSLPIGHRECL